MSEIVNYEDSPIVQYAGGAVVEIEKSRSVQESQAAMVVAQKFPRDELNAENRIVAACKRSGVAKKAIYSYPRGGQTVSGPSVHLMRTIAKCWGNINFGIRELSQEDGQSEMEAYCHDLETNVRASRQFIVKHMRKAQGQYQLLDDPRDVYEHTANMGARRVRACIMEIIPDDIVEMAVDQCNKTLCGDSDEPLKDRVRKMIVAFEKIGISRSEIEEHLGKSVNNIIEIDLSNLRSIYNSLKDGMGKKEDWFKNKTSLLDDLNATGSQNEESDDKKRTRRTKLEMMKDEARSIAEEAGVDEKVIENTLDTDDKEKVQEWIDNWKSLVRLPEIK